MKIIPWWIRWINLKGKSLNKGLTLIEVIVSIAILGIILLSFLNVFSNGLITIFTMGHRTRAISEAQAIVDTVTSAGDVSDEFIESIDPDETYKKVINHNLLTSNSYTERVRYCIEDRSYSVGGKNYTQKIITVAILYNNGKNNVLLTSPVP